MHNIEDVNLKVLLMDTDFYALQAVNSYLAWDRRTRVTNMSESPLQMWEHIQTTPLAELPNVILLESDHLGGPGLRDTIHARSRRLKTCALCVNSPMTI
jgi:hypothetical protein